jgi:hypothetical protein
MKKYTQKEIREFVRLGLAIDITNYNHAEMWNFLKSHRIEKVGYSSGIYGINGGLLIDEETGEKYAITARSTALLTAF